MKVTSKSSTVKSNGSRSAGSNSAPARKSSYWLSGVGEAVLGHHDDAALEAPEPADGEADQHDQHREVEQQVAGLAQVAALGARPTARRRPGAVDPEVLAVSSARRPLERDLGGLVGLEGAVLRQPGEVPRRRRRPRAYAAPVDPQPGQEAADQRDHQQDVDRREPRRVVDREQPELLVDRGQLRVLVAPLRGTQRVHRLLRHHRARGSRRARAGTAGSARSASR